MKRKMILFSALLFSALVFFEACKHEIPVIPGGGNNGGGGTGGGGSQTPDYTCSPDTVYFENTIAPLIASSCAMTGCHDNVTHADGVRLTNYSQIVQYVRPGNAANSKLYKVMIETGGDRMPPPPNAAMTPAQLLAVQKWINQGAKNNACNECDTTDFKYSTAIQPIIQNKCQGCHNPNSLGGGIDLSTYAAVKVTALNGKLYGSVNWAAGYSPMPKNANKLPSCEITQIKKWIDAGSLNN